MRNSLSEYLTTLGDWHQEFVTHCPSEIYGANVASHWFNKIAPNKAVEYGLECWLRLGARALVVDLNACFYRWKSIKEKEQGITDHYGAWENVLRDSFGYSVMLNCFQDVKPISMEWDFVFMDRDPANANDQLVNDVWEQGIEDDAGAIAMNMAYNMSKHKWSL